MKGERKVWRRLVDTGPKSADYLMALDEVLLDLITAGRSLNTLRFLRFEKPTVLVGFNQVVEDEVNIEYCEVNGLDINRRITGGGAILMEPSAVGWELIAKKDVLSGLGTMEDIYRNLCQGCILALRELGIDAQFRPHNDIEINGRKISGAGGTDLGDTFLFHGSILVDLDLECMVNALKIPAAKLSDKGIASMKERLTWIKREIEVPPTLEEIMDGVARGFEQVLGIQYEPGNLTPLEERELEKHLPRFQSEEWIYARKKPGALTEGEAAYKAPGGLIRVSLVLDKVRNRVQSLMITGDFFAYPSRIITDLESHLRFCSIQREELDNRIKEFFEGKQYHIPGVTPAHILRAIEEAIRDGRRVGNQDGN